MPPPPPPSFRSGPSGPRKIVKSSDFTPLDAEVQPRAYVTPSRTSRKTIPPSIKRKHGDIEDPVELLTLVEKKRSAPPFFCFPVSDQDFRRQNTDAARRSRHRKQIQSERQEARITQLEAALRAGGLAVPPEPQQLEFPDED